MTNLKIYLLSPRGFCFGVSKALSLLDSKIKKEKPFVYHAIIHNKNVIQSYEKQGIQFISSLDEIPDNSPLFTSAHGIGEDIRLKAKEKNLTLIDGACPFVLKVHKQLKTIIKEGLTPLIIGKKGHDEILGLQGEIPPSTPFHILENVKDVEALNPSCFYGYVTQTTLNQEDTAKIEQALEKRLGDNLKFKFKGICAATSMRQNIVKKTIDFYDALFVIGDRTSSNSKKLVEVAKNGGLQNSFLIENKNDFFRFFSDDFKKIALTTSASAREEGITLLLKELQKSYTLEVSELSQTKTGDVQTNALKEDKTL
ncbi:MAG: 4-hydroxy-3-methylbut-2-enyl diphosphate reductase [Alphaproteobacteria bacterium]|nr:4-hydroxy-3-methylbut-2-enyl diphosphate reductase [Alphaproteobacteria bacterium]